MMPRSPYLLNFCAGFSVLASLQILSSWLWVDLTKSNWSIAWCDSTSSLARWIFLYLWALTGVAVAFNTLKRRFIVAYFWTMFSFVSFWFLVFAFAAASHRNDSSGALALLVFLGLMILSLKRYKRRLQISNYDGKRGGGLAALPRASLP